MSENTLPYNQLVVLIYRHLMDNGYQNVANALKKHAPQEVWGPVDVSLIGIYSWWRSQNPSSASEQVDVPRHAAGKTRTKRPSANTSRIQKCSTTEGGRQEDSDSDTCLDVEKWRRRVSQISDADRAKMDILSNFDKSTGISKGTIKKQTHAKDQRISTGEGKTSSAKSTELPAKTKPTTRRTKKDEKKDAEAISNPEKGNMASTNEYGPTKADVQAEDVGVSLFSNVNNTTKASEAQKQIETFAPAEVEDPSKTPKTPSKKAKKKKRSSEVGETADHNQSCSEDVSSSTVSQCEGANLNTSFITPMTPMVSSTLKPKTKFYDSTCDETPSKKGKSKKCKTPTKLDQDALSNEPDVCLEEKLSFSSKKAKHKTLDSETPSKKRKTKNLLSTTQPEAAEMPRSKLKDKSNIHSVKSNGNAEMNNVHESGEQSDILSETLLIGTTGDVGNDEIACGEVKSKKKKKKRKREEACEVSLFEEPEPELKKFKKAKNKGTDVDASPALAEDVLVGEEENRKKKKKKTEESVSPVVVETISHKKKKKKKNQSQNEEVSVLNGT